MTATFVLVCNTILTGWGCRDITARLRTLHHTGNGPPLPSVTPTRFPSNGLWFGHEQPGSPVHLRRRFRSDTASEDGGFCGYTWVEDMNVSAGWDVGCAFKKAAGRYNKQVWWESASCWNPRLHMSSYSKEFYIGDRRSGESSGQS